MGDSMRASISLHDPRARRALVIAMCRRRQRPGTGSLMSALMEEGRVMDVPDLRDVLGPLRWAVVGAIAARLYMPERTTVDLDVLVAAGDRDATEKRLAHAGWERTGDLTIGGSAWRSPQGRALDLVCSKAPWAQAALEEAQQNRDADGLPICPLPYLVLLKLRASRTIDIADVSRMLGLADEAALERVRSVMAEYAPEDLDDLEALIELGRLECRGQ
jgi:hypothetical protein